MTGSEVSTVSEPDNKPNDIDKSQQDASVGCGVLVLLAVGVWAVGVWRKEGIGGFLSLFTNFWDTVVLGSLRAMSDPSFWMDTWLGWILIIGLWWVFLTSLGKYSAKLSEGTYKGWLSVLPERIARLATIATLLGVLGFASVSIHDWMWPDPVDQDEAVAGRVELLDELIDWDAYGDPKLAGERIQQLLDKSEWLQPDPDKRKLLEIELNNAMKHVSSVEGTYEERWEIHLGEIVERAREHCALGQPEKSFDGSSFHPHKLMLLSFVLLIVTLAAISPDKKS